MPGPSTPITVGNTAYLSIMDERFMVQILGVEGNAIWVSFPGACYPLNGMGGRLEFHRPEGLSAYNVQVLRYADGQAKGIILERSESAEHRTHRTAWRVPTDMTVAVQLPDSDYRFSAVMENISADGALLRAHPVLPIRATVHMTFSLDREHGEQLAEGRVCYAQEASSMTTPPAQHYGIRFTTMNADTRRLLTLFLYPHIRKIYPKDVAAMYPRTRRRK
ncbi:MAG: PilZ domain-containing protein [Candidatus Hydrogenedentes bacterium]|nr:PilZ domain-containing protein [Candidatus Hydrogenedentota bacterium]